MRTLTLLVFTALLFAVAVPRRAVSHDWYSGLRARSGLACCDGRDCRPVPHRFSQDQTLEILIDGSWEPVDPSTILAMASPDNAVHACYRYPSGRELGLVVQPVVICVILPGTS